MGESRTHAEDVEELWEEIRAKRGECRQAVRDAIAEARVEMGHAECRKTLTRLLTDDGVTYSEATACVNRLERLRPEDEDLDLVGEALIGQASRSAELKEEDESESAIEAKWQAEEKVVVDDALMLLLACFLRETGREIESLDDVRHLDEWGRWLAKRWDIDPAIAEPIISRLREGTGKQLDRLGA